MSIKSVPWTPAQLIPGAFYGRESPGNKVVGSIKTVPGALALALALARIPRYARVSQINTPWKPTVKTHDSDMQPSYSEDNTHDQ